MKRLFNIKFWDIVSFIAIFQFVFFAFFLLVNKKGKKISNRIFSIFLLISALNYFFIMQRKFSLILLPPPSYLFFFIIALQFSLGPSLYLYTKSLIYRNYQFSKYHLLHLVPIFLHIVIWIGDILFFNQNPFKGLIFKIQQNKTFSLIYHGLIFLHFTCYIIFTLLTLRKFKEKLKHKFSNLEKIQLNWLRNLFLFVFFLLLFSTFLTIFSVEGYNIVLQKILLYLIIFIFVNVIVFKGLLHPEIFAGIENREKYKKTTLPPEKLTEYFKKISDFMTHNKPYLDPTLSLDQLAKELNIPAHHVSQVINRCTEMNFYQFVNHYRVEESMDLFKEDKKNTRTILDILYDCGFNTKATFNEVFKRYTGMTPSEYKKNLKKSTTL